MRARPMDSAAREKMIPWSYISGGAACINDSAIAYVIARTLVIRHATFFKLFNILKSDATCRTELFNIHIDCLYQQ